MGNYRLKTKYKEARLAKDEIYIPYKIVNPDDIIEYVKSSINDVTVSTNEKKTIANIKGKCH